MSFSEQAIAYRLIPPHDQVRFSDRVSFLWIDRAQVRQDDTGIVAILRRDTTEQTVDRIPLQIPAGGIALVVLGNGTSISQPAAVSLARCGTTLAFGGSGGLVTYSHAVPLTASAKWALAQARLVADHQASLEAARRLYAVQFGSAAPFLGASFDALRGVEGQMMKAAYRIEAAKNGVKGFRRRYDAEDPVNTCLNIGGGILYGIAASACTALGLNPALGVIHRGNIRSMTHDLADLFKVTITIPTAFKVGARKLTDHLPIFRRELRDALERNEVLETMITTLQEILAPHLHGHDQLAGDPNQIIASEGSVEGGWSQS